MGMEYTIMEKVAIGEKVVKLKEEEKFMPE
jgi:hypothetical protein